MKKIRLQILVLLALLAGGVSLKAANDYNVYAYWVLGPLRTNQAAFDSWSSNEVHKLYQNRTLADDDVAPRLLTSHVTQPTDLSSNTLWLAVRVTDKPNGPKVSLTMLKFAEKSSDPANSLSNLYSLVGVTNLIYSHRALGVTWNGGERVSDILDTSGDASGQKDEVDFIGMQSAYYPYPTPADLSNIDQYISSFTNANGFELTGTCSVIDASNNVAALGARTLQTKGLPLRPVLAITNGLNAVTIGFNLETNRTVVLKSSPDPTLSFSSWSVVGTYNAGDLPEFPTANNPVVVYAAALEPYP